MRNARFELLVMMTLLASSATLGVETHVAMQDLHSAAGINSLVFGCGFVPGLFVLAETRVSRFFPKEQ